MKNSTVHGKSGLFSLFLAAAGTVVFGLLWLNNVLSAWRYHVLLFRQGALDTLPDGFRPALTWTAIDVSTVTTFIPFFGFLLLFAGLCRIRQTEFWPFFRNYDRLNIALGLIGTLWGIILIGFYPSNQVTVAALMRCLHTAMFSTLAAIIWVMVLEPLIIQPWMNAVRKAAHGTPAEESSIEELADSLLNGLHDAGNELKSTTAFSAQFREELEKLHKELAAVVSEIARTRENETQWRENTMECLRDLAAVAEGFRANQEKLAKENAALSEKRDSLERELAAACEESTRLKRQLDAIREALR